MSRQAGSGRRDASEIEIASEYRNGLDTSLRSSGGHHLRETHRNELWEKQIWGLKTEV